MSYPFNIETQSDKIESKIVVALERISEAFRVLLWEETKRNSLSPIQIQILIFLLYHSEEKAKVSYLAEEFNLSKATISDSIGSLLKKGLITRTANPVDTRIYKLQLTASGIETAVKSANFTSAIEAPLDLLGPEQKTAMLHGLLNIICELNKCGVISIQRMCLTCKHYTLSGGNHYCHLLRSRLANTELRVDCKEHVFKPGKPAA